MPVSSDIYGQIQPVQQRNPLAEAAQFMQLQRAMGQNALSTYALAKAQRDDADNAALRADLAVPGADAAAALLRQGRTKEAADYQHTTAQAGELKAKTAKTSAEAVTERANQYRDQWAAVPDAQSAAQLLTTMHNDPAFAGTPMQSVPIEAKLSALQQASANPAAFAAFKEQMSLAAPKFAEMATQRRGQDMTAATAKTGQAVTMRGQDMLDRRATAGQAIEAARVDPFGTLGVNKNVSPQAAAGAGVSGDAYLATLDPKMAAQVKAIAEGRLQVSPMMMRSPQGAALVQMAMQYEPGTDQTTYQKRQATAKDAASGNLAKSNNALNTVAGHLVDLQSAAEALNNTRMPMYNQAANWMADATGDPRIKAFKLNAQGVASELERAYRGSGGSEKDIQEWRGNLSAANSPEQFAGVLQKAADMLQSKLEANQAQYEQGMSGRPGDYKAITPKAAAAFAKLRGGAAQPAAAGGVPPDIAAILDKHGKK